MAKVILIKDLSFTFANSESPVLRRINLQFMPGEFALICGPTGSGKSTLLRALTGLVPFYSSGQLSGEVWLNGTQLAGRQPHEFSHLVGYVNQQPEGAFVSETVIEELAFGMEQLGFPVEVMNQNIAKYAQLLGITALLHSNLEFLSGGQQQRVAIAAVLACGQKILLLDEPMSALDVTAADELLALLKQLCTEHGITVLLAEHRIERAIGLVDSVIVVNGDGSANKALVASGLDPVLRDYRMVPPVIELGQRLQWNPLPLSIESAKKTWEMLPGMVHIEELTESADELVAARKPSMAAIDVSIYYGPQLALNAANLELFPGTVHALMGPNGSGKTSLLWALQGSLKHTGLVQVMVHEAGTFAAPASLPAQDRISHIAMVPQTAADLLVLTSVSAELEESDRFAGAAAGTTAKSFASLAGRIDPNRHPHDLSAGQQIALVLAIQLAKGASNILLDEPTRGLDYQAKRNLAAQLQSLAASGKAVLVASHDVEFVALVADTVTLISDGRLTLEGPASQVLATLGSHAPQVMQVTGKAWRTEQVAKQ